MSPRNVAGLDLTLTLRHRGDPEIGDDSRVRPLGLYTEMVENPLSPTQKGPT